MHYRAIGRTIGILLIIISLFILLCAGIALIYGETRAMKAFLETFFTQAVIGSSLVFFLNRTKKMTLSARDGFLLVGLSWIFVGIAGSFPYYLSGAIPSFSDCFFETVSGFSTTGASILTEIESLPKSILFWRSLTHWLGGMGIIVLTVAILPLLGIGGMQLIKAEAPGPTVDKITPRITETAKYLWLIYLAFTITETFLLMLGGMDLYNALTHTFGTVATGGFSTLNSSVGQFDSAYFDWVITIFMVLAGINFSLHFKLITGNFKGVTKDTELRWYLGIIIIATLAITLNLFSYKYDSFFDSLRYAAFQVAAFVTTTGFGTDNYEDWPYFAQTVLFLMMMVGGCSGSTGGGLKVVRVVTLLKQAVNEMKYLMHPRSIFTVKVSGHTVKKDIAYAISGFFFLYMLMVLLVTLIVATSGTDLLTSLTAALSTVGNIGPGFGEIGPTENYAHFPAYVKWVLSFAMVVGRLEIYTILVMFTPIFWKR